MSMMTGTITVRDTEYTVTFNPEWGASEYTADVNGNRVTSKTWKALAAAVGAELRKREITVAVEFVHPETGKRGTATRLHASRREPVVIWEDGSTTTGAVSSPLRPDTDPAELRRLIGNAKRAERALREFRDAHKGAHYSLAGAVETELARVVAEREAAERAEGAIDLDGATADA